jgi:chromosomal replication initiator protein
LPAEVVEYIAQRDQTNIRELEGALNKVLAYATITGKSLGIETAIEALTDASRTIRRESLMPQDIIDAVAGHFRIDLDDMRGSSRSQKNVVPRQVAMYLIRELTRISLVDIGDVLGGRDHTTIMHGIDKINRGIETDAGLRSHITQIRESLLTS